MIESRKEMCKEHNKPIEGFCQQDRVLLCINCILSGEHKNHEILGIQKGAQFEKDKLTEKFKASK